MKNISAFCLITYLSIISYSVHGQNFLWGRSGGSGEPTQGSNEESVEDMATDRNGNVYILSHINQLGLHAAGTPLTGFGVSDIMLASFRPDGSFRWAKIVGTIGSADKALWMGTDAKDGVYFCGFTNKWNNGPAYIDADAISPMNYQRAILVKYDTAGNYQWHRHPESDTISGHYASSYFRSLVMDVDDAGNTYWMARLYPGAYGGGALNVTTTGTYILKYSASGNFSYIKPDLDIDDFGASGMNMAIDDAHDRFYLSGGVSSHDPIIDTPLLKMGNMRIENSMYVGCFKLDGSFLWKKENTLGPGAAGFYSRAVFDDDGNIYLAGKSMAPNQSYAGDTFNGYAITHGYGNSIPFVVKLDKNGNLIWAKDAESSNFSFAGAIALRKPDEVIIAGKYVGYLEWPGHPHLRLATSSLYDVFITRFDADNGWVVGTDRIPSDYSQIESARRMVADDSGNVYIGGDFEGTMYASHLDTLKNTGNGDTDWFLVKYGDRWPKSIHQVETSDFKVYPNPASDHLFIEGGDRGTTWCIYTMLGQKMYHGQLNHIKEVIDIRELQPGNYFLSMTDARGNKTTKLIVKQFW